MTSKQVIEEIKKSGSEGIKKIFLRHGAKEPFYGVKVEDLKKIQKKIKENHQQIALDLYRSGIGDAMYLAGLMADGSKMNPKELQGWVEAATWSMISEYSVPWVTAENDKAFDLATKWIDSPKETIASSGWSTLSSIVATWPDEELDITALKKLLSRVQKEIQNAPNRVKYSMNGFVIAVGSYVKDLTSLAVETGKKIGVVMVEMEGTACRVPFSPDYIKKVVDKGTVGKKKKTAKC
jgi:3-methyladenine DNA glycosylase AlkD